MPGSSHTELDENKIGSSKLGKFPSETLPERKFKMKPLRVQIPVVGTRSFSVKTNKGYQSMKKMIRLLKHKTRPW